MTNAEFEKLVAPVRGQLKAHCYRMLGALPDAEDALQDALLGAFRGIDGWEGTGTLRAWLFQCATNACLALIAKRPKRLLADDFGPAEKGTDVGPMHLEPVWLEPYPDDPAMRLEELESVELAFMAALQALPATQRATLLLREVLEFSADEVAALLATSTASVNSALQRARASMAERGPARSQLATLRDLGDAAQRELVATYVEAWRRRDVDAIVRLLAQDAKFTMPAIPSWFDGRDSVARFLRERVFATDWRLEPLRASGQLAFACYQGPGFSLSALQVVTLRGGAIERMTAFLDPAVHRKFLLADR